MPRLTTPTERKPLKNLLVLIHLTQLRLETLIDRYDRRGLIRHGEVPDLDVEQVAGGEEPLVLGEGRGAVAGDDLSEEVLGGGGVVEE